MAVQEHPRIHIKARATPENRAAIERYWNEIDRNHTNRPEGHAWGDPNLEVLACIQYLRDTGRMTDEEYEHINMNDLVHSPITAVPFQRRCTIARTEDGDITMWTNRPGRAEATHHGVEGRS